MSTQHPGSQADTLLARFMRVEKNGKLARHVRTVVETNRRKATKPYCRVA